MEKDRDAVARKLVRLQAAVGHLRERCDTDTDVWKKENLLAQQQKKLQQLQGQNDFLNRLLEQNKPERSRSRSLLFEDLASRVRFAKSDYGAAKRELRDLEKKMREEELALERVEKLLQRKRQVPGAPKSYGDTIRQLEKHKTLLAQSVVADEKRYQSQKKELASMIQSKRESVEEVEKDVKHKEDILRQLYRKHAFRNGAPRNAGGRNDAHTGGRNDARMPTVEELSVEIQALRLRMR